MSFRLFLTMFILSFTTTSCQNMGESSMYLIPKGFEGNVLVVYNQPDGKDTLYENHTRVYKIDPSGILKTKFIHDRRTQIVNFYSIDENGKRQPIQLISNEFPKIKDSSEVVCVHLVPMNDFDEKRKTQRYFDIFTIAKPKNIDSILDRRDAFTSNWECIQK